MYWYCTKPEISTKKDFIINFNYFWLCKSPTNVYTGISWGVFRHKSREEVCESSIQLYCSYKTKTEVYVYETHRYNTSV